MSKLSKPISLLCLALVLLTVLVPVAVVYASPQKFEWCNTASTTYFTGTNGNRWRAQTFTAISTHSITSVKVYIKRINNPDTVVLSIRNANTLPQGSDLVSQTLPGSSLHSIGRWEEFVFLSAITVEKDKSYAICIRSTHSTDTENNHVSWSCYWNSVHGDKCGGQSCYSDTGGSSWDSLAADQRFEVWGEPSSVGGEVYPIDRFGILAPWLGLVVLLAVGGVLVVMRRRQVH